MKLKDLFEELTLTQLLQKTKQGFPKTKRRQHITHNVNVTGMKVKTNVPARTLQVSASTTSVDSGNKHTPTILLQDVEYLTGKKIDKVRVKGTNGISYSLVPVKLNINNSRVACDCEDYRYRFAYYNTQNNCHFGNPPEPYQRKTQDYPEANPQHVPGMCVHIIKLSNVLKKQGILL